MADPLFILSVIITIIFGVMVIIGIIIAALPASNTTGKTNGGWALLVFAIIGVILGFIVMFESKHETSAHGLPVNAGTVGKLESLAKFAAV